jgi:AmmeMemoRadiSam system protein A
VTAEVLARFARDHLRHTFGGEAATRPTGYGEQGAAFVTLRWRDGSLQGCIGSLEAHRPLIDDVAANAIAAATRDRRGRAVSLPDIDALDVEVSILSPLEPIASVADIRRGTDGVVLVRPPHRATFLPVMWARLPELDTFMAALRDKLGSRENAMYRYTVEHHLDLGR